MVRAPKGEAVMGEKFFSSALSGFGKRSDIGAVRNEAHAFLTIGEHPMSQIKNIAALAASLIAASAFATAHAGEQKCGAGTCGKKESSAPAAGKDAACSKKDAACAKKDEGKEAACSKKEAACSKKEAKEAACAKKEAACSKKEAACAKK